MKDTEAEYDSIEDPLSMYKTASNEITPNSDILSINNEENVIIALKKEKKTVSILSDEFR